ncbi:hypothetical protein NC99_42410 [Sunxiuqinia dokdonensis]|uniref:Uncharacterized protein n=1 Tax=Sunxiuqinia dokdonensis TaxID=1409788 RepID=A0A0L8V3E7_9BACT|nr:hypothetical protein NC99_42410 [Sunxiuqinia dokdonensis]
MWEYASILKRMLNEFSLRVQESKIITYGQYLTMPVRLPFLK